MALDETAATRRYTADIDTGGTFTDGYFSDGDRYWMAKVETTPHDFTVGFLACLEQGARRIGLADLRALLRRCEAIRFCTTLTTNALVEGRGTRLGLIASRGLPAEIEDLDRLVTPELVAELDEDAAARRPEIVVAAARRLLGQGARALVVALRGSAEGPVGERAIEGILDAEYPPHRLGHVPITLAHQVSRRPEDARRAVAALLDARVHALLARSLREAEDALRERGSAGPLLVVHADGGCGRVAKTRALDTYASGPAAVVHGAARVCERDARVAIALDIGGTTTDLAFVKGAEPRLVPDGRIRGHRVGQPLPEVFSLGAGGGSIARMTDGRLAVGPESAGALPGPACFDLGGTEATVTDACLALGFFAPERFGGGRRHLRGDLAEQALERLAPGVPPARTAAAVKEALEAQVAAAIRARVRGTELGGARLLALGGGGGLHAAAIASKLGLREVELFPWSPVFGAFGASTLDVVHVYQASLAGLNTGGRLELGAWYAELIAAARRDLADEGFTGGVAFELLLEHPAATGDGATALSRHAVGAEQEIVTLPDAPPPVMAWLRARHALPRSAEGTRHPGGAPDASQTLGARRVQWGAGERAHTTAVFSLDALAADQGLPGPCLVEGEFATLAVPPGWTFTVERNGWMNLRA